MLKKNIIVGFCTVPTEKIAEELSSMLLEKRLISCVNIIPKVRSKYRWEGKIYDEKELYLVMKSQPKFKEKLTSVIKANHPYKVPEIIFSEFSGGNQDYINWVYFETKTSLN